MLYVDDCLIIGARPVIIDHRDFVLHTFQEFGFVINFDKSILEPASRIDFIGYIIDTTGPNGQP